MYRRRWQYDKKVRSTHGVNCTGSCSWDVYVKDGILVWETQATDYPACGEGYPNHEPRGCPRGATYSWYTYSPAAVGGAAGIVGGLGAFGGFVLPPVMGMFVKFNGPAGYAQGFSVFLVLSLLAIGFIVLLTRQAPVGETTIP